MSSNPQLLSGARGVIKSGNNILAFATDVTVNVRHNVKPTFTVGRMNASAIDSITYDVDVSVGRVIPVNKSDADATVGGNPPVTGTDTSDIAMSLEVVIAQIVSAGDIDIVLTDRVTGATISAVKGCRFSGRSLSMNANDTASERLNFVGIYDAGYLASGGSSPENSATDGYGL